MIGKRHVSTHKIICWRFTRYCNRQCAFCLSQSSPEFSHPTYDCQSIASRLADIGVEKIFFTGGEPTLHPQLGDAIKELNQYGIRQIVATNGSALRNKMELLKYLEYVKLSFYGCSDVHDSIVRKGDYANLLALAKDLHSQGYIVGVNLMLSRLSLPVLKKSLSDFLSAGIRHVLLLSYIPTGNTDVDQIHQIDLSPVTFELIRSEVGSLVGEFDGGIKIHDNAEVDFTIVLDEKCHLWLAGYHGGNDYCLGNLFDNSIITPQGHRGGIASSIENIWERRLDSEAIISL